MTHCCQTREQHWLLSEIEIVLSNPEQQGEVGPGQRVGLGGRGEL